MAAQSYEDVAVLEEDGVTARITRRRRPHLKTQYSFSFSRVFEKEGDRRRSAWLDGRHLDALAKLIVRIRERIDIEIDRETTARHR